jgi:hypothetical protein
VAGLDARPDWVGVAKRPGYWLAEVALAYRNALEAVPFAPLAGTEITPDNLFHLAPVVCLKFRGMQQRRGALKQPDA